MRVYKVTLKGQGCYVDADLDNALACLKGDLGNMQPDDQYIVSCEEMTKEQIAALPEFDGF